MPTIFYRILIYIFFHFEVFLFFIIIEETGLLMICTNMEIYKMHMLKSQEQK